MNWLLAACFSLLFGVASLKIIECVPNFSEGRRKEVIDAIANAARGVDGITVLDCESDANHNRMVLTFIGSPDSVKRAALEASAVAVKLIDLTKHSGEHPRMGAVDVVPFVPLRDSSVEECVLLANEFADEYSKRFNVPVFLYESSARSPSRKDLAKVREGQFEGLRELLGKDPSKDPDYGPKKIHPTAGATAVGARQILIAYNINLGTKDVSIAKKIAHRIRERDGGLSNVKALGFELGDREMSQVSMNLTDYTVTSILKAYDAVSKISKELNVPIVESEIVGLVPLAAISEAGSERLRLVNFSPGQIIENKLLDVAMRKADDERDFSKFSLEEFVSKMSSKDPTPGGGTASAYAGALASSLVAMVCRLTIGKKGYESVDSRMTLVLKEAEECTTKLMDLGNKDSQAYDRVSKALGLPKDSEYEKSSRRVEMKEALKEATEVPSETMLTSFHVFELAKEVLKFGNTNASSDAETAVELSRAAVRGAWSNVRINLETLKDEPEFVKSKFRSLENILASVTA
jgi:glutamate formiminotransferase/formiminotetrahydrofolate cyclodeaminase